MQHMFKHGTTHIHPPFYYTVVHFTQSEVPLIIRQLQYPLEQELGGCNLPDTVCSTRDHCNKSNQTLQQET